MFRDLVSGQEQLLAEEPIIINPDVYVSNDILKMASLSSGTTAILYPKRIRMMDTTESFRYKRC